MRLRSSTLWLLSVLLLAAMPIRAEIRWHADVLAVPGITAHQLQATVSDAGNGTLALELSLGQLDVDALGWRGVGLSCHGSITRQAARRWQLQGELALRGAPGNALRKSGVKLQLDGDQNTLALVLEQQGRKLDVAWPLDELAHMQIHLASIPVGWLQGVLAQIWSQGKMGQGEVSASLSLDVEDTGLRSSGRYTLSKTGFDSSDGSMAGQGIDSHGRWTVSSRGPDTTMDLDAQFSGGELLLGPLYASLPASNSRLRLTVDSSARGIALKRLHFDDGKFLRVDGMLGFDRNGKLDSVRMDGLRAIFPGAWQHYARTMLATAGFPDLSMEGMLTLSGAWDTAEGWQRFALDADDLNVRDARQRVGMTNLDGRLDWSRDDTRKPTRLAWDGLTLLSLNLGRAETAWQSRDGTLGLTAPSTVPMMGGNVFVNQLAWSPGAPPGQQQIAASLAYSGIDLARLSAAFGWPAFQGVVGGAIPGLQYDGERLKLDGGVSVNVFDGFVDVTQLVLKHPFGPAPVLNATVDFRDLDLAPMTRIFDFGGITGRLEGQVSGLRMVAWNPVAFSARLVANQGGRISQKAVNSISNLGGGGIAGGLQTTVLRVFDSFGYKRIGLGCVLKDDVCIMSGLGKADGGGYTIVEGRGLPHIAVIGHQREVDWSTLVARLKAATSGGNIKVE